MTGTIRPLGPGDAAPTFSYSGDPSSSPLDQVRFTVQDTDPSMPLLTDAEYSWLIAQWMPRYDSLTYVASIAAATISRKFVGIVDVSGDGVSVGTANLSDRYRALAEQLRAEYIASQITGAEIDISNLMVGQDVDYSIKPLRFAVGLHDNIEAGMQDFGGWLGGIETYWAGSPW